jgi:hypothetical protein
MTREQSRQIRQIEYIVDALSECVDFMTAPSNLQKFAPLTPSPKVIVMPPEEYCKDVEALNAKVHDYELGLVKELKDKYLKIYTEL